MHILNGNIVDIPIGDILKIVYKKGPLSREYFDRIKEYHIDNIANNKKKLIKKIQSIKFEDYEPNKKDDSGFIKLQERYDKLKQDYDLKYSADIKEKYTIIDFMKDFNIKYKTYIQFNEREEYLKSKVQILQNSYNGINKLYEELLKKHITPKHGNNFYEGRSNRVEYINESLIELISQITENFDTHDFGKYLMTDFKLNDRHEPIVILSTLIDHITERMNDYFVEFQKTKNEEYVDRLKELEKSAVDRVTNYEIRGNSTYNMLGISLNNLNIFERIKSEIMIYGNLKMLQEEISKDLPKNKKNLVFYMNKILKEEPDYSFDNNNIMGIYYMLEKFIISCEKYVKEKLGKTENLGFTDFETIEKRKKICSEIDMYMKNHISLIQNITTTYDNEIGSDLLALYIELNSDIDVIVERKEVSNLYLYSLSVYSLIKIRYDIDVNFEFISNNVDWVLTFIDQDKREFLKPVLERLNEALWESYIEQIGKSVPNYSELDVDTLRMLDDFFLKPICKYDKEKIVTIIELLDPSYMTTLIKQNDMTNVQQMIFEDIKNEISVKYDIMYSDYKKLLSKYKNIDEDKMIKFVNRIIFKYEEPNMMTVPERLLLLNSPMLYRSSESIKTEYNFRKEFEEEKNRVHEYYRAEIKKMSSIKDAEYSSLNSKYMELKEKIHNQSMNYMLIEDSLDKATERYENLKELYDETHKKYKELELNPKVKKDTKKEDSDFVDLIDSDWDLTEKERKLTNMLAFKELEIESLRSRLELRDSIEGSIISDISKNSGEELRAEFGHDMTRERFNVSKSTYQTFLKFVRDKEFYDVDEKKKPRKKDMPNVINDVVITHFNIEQAMISPLYTDKFIFTFLSKEQILDYFFPDPLVDRSEILELFSKKNMSKRYQFFSLTYLALIFIFKKYIQICSTYNLDFAKFLAANENEIPKNVDSIYAMYVNARNHIINLEQKLDENSIEYDKYHTERNIHVIYSERFNPKTDSGDNNIKISEKQKEELREEFLEDFIENYKVTSHGKKYNIYELKKAYDHVKPSEILESEVSGIIEIKTIDQTAKDEIKNLRKNIKDLEQVIRERDHKYKLAVVEEAWSPEVKKLKKQNEILTEVNEKREKDLKKILLDGMEKLKEKDKIIDDLRIEIDKLKEINNPMVDDLLEMKNRYIERDRQLEEMRIQYKSLYEKYTKDYDKKSIIDIEIVSDEFIENVSEKAVDKIIKKQNNKIMKLIGENKKLLSEIRDIQKEKNLITRKYEEIKNINEIKDYSVLPLYIQDQIQELKNTIIAYEIKVDYEKTVVNRKLSETNFNLKKEIENLNQRIKNMEQEIQLTNDSIEIKIDGKIYVKYGEYIKLQRINNKYNRPAFDLDEEIQKVKRSFENDLNDRRLTIKALRNENAEFRKKEKENFSVYLDKISKLENELYKEKILRSEVQRDFLDYKNDSGPQTEHLKPLRMYIKRLNKRLEQVEYLKTVEEYDEEYKSKHNYKKSYRVYAKYIEEKFREKEAKYIEEIEKLTEEIRTLEFDGKLKRPPI